MPSRLHVEITGDGPPVILVHSSGLSGRQWRRLASLLVKRGFRAIVPDLTGHGSSPPLPEPAPFSYVADVEALVALLETYAPVHLVGHSYGGLIAILAAVRAPKALLSLTLFDPVAFAVLDRPEDGTALLELGSVASPWGTSERDHEAWLQAFVEYWGGEGAWLALREEARAEFRRVGWAVQQGVSTLVDDRTPNDAYRAITCPVTVMTGELSPLAARSVVMRLAETLPQARIVSVPGAGHMAPLSHGDLVNQAIVETITSAPQD